MQRQSSFALRLIPFAALLVAGGCANLPGDAAKPATAAPAAAPAVASASAPSAAVAAARPASAASGAAPSAAPPVPGQPPAFAVVIKDAKKIDGMVTMYQKDEKVWLELKPSDFGKPFYLSPKLASGIGEARIYAGLMATPHIVEFRRVHNQVQLIARNTDYVAKAGKPEARATAASFPASLLASTAVASLPHPERKTVLVEAVPLFVNDMLGVGAELGRTYRQGYGLDRGNSAIMSVRGKSDLIVVETMNHYATPVLAQPTPGAPPTAPQPSAPRTPPDPRSMFINVHYSLAALPETPMAGRPVDARLGHFPTSYNDFSDDLARTPRVRNVLRWRLEKKDPTAELSEPVKPITYWIDKNVPVKYRESIRAGILEWNKAFEKIGFKDAVRAEIQPDNADFDTLDFGIASVRWINSAVPAFGAIGPSHADPRSGEILDADIAIESMSSRNVRGYRTRVYTDAADWQSALQIGGADAAAKMNIMACEHADLAAEQLAYGLDVLAAQGDLDPDSPEAEAFVQAYLKDVTMHEVGHTLGLRHNFRASRIYTDAQLSDPEFTKDHALTGSVMEYAAINLPRPGEKRPAPFSVTLGPYDYWVIEYAYKQIAPDQEAAELKRIGARSAEPELAYGTDEDNFFGLDPESLQRDLGSDPFTFARKRLDIAADLFKRQESRQLKPNEDYGALRRSLRLAVLDVGTVTGVMLRQIGGLRTLRDYPGTGRDPLQPVAAADQRAALDMISRRLLSADGFAVSPALSRRLAPDYLEQTDGLFTGEGLVPSDYPLAQQLHALRSAILAQLMSDSLAARVLDGENKVARSSDAFHLNELYQRLEADVWSELRAKGDIPGPRRDLQREYVNRLSALVLRPAGLSRGDARSLVRVQASELLGRIDGAAKRPGLSDEARLHLKDSAESLRSALAAGLQRTGG